MVSEKVFSSSYLTSLAEMAGMEFCECGVISCQVFRTLVFHLAEPVVAILFQAYPCRVFPEVSVTCKKTCEET